MFDTKLEEIQRRYKILDIIHQSPQSIHYYVEEMDNINEESIPIYYLKQYKFSTRKEFLFFKDYYIKFYNYFLQRTSSKEVAELLRIFDFDDPMETNYELVIVLEFGETDRIDVNQIETNHINKFMKNVSLLLCQLKK